MSKMLDFLMTHDARVSGLCLMFFKQHQISETCGVDGIRLDLQQYYENVKKFATENRCNATQKQK